MALLNSHLDDAALADVWTERVAGGNPAGSRPAAAHLRDCRECQARYTAFTDWLEALRTDAEAEADEVFTPDRLAAQQANIVRRLDVLEQPGRVIAFPRFAQPIAVQPSDGRRWIAAAAAAGLVVGLGLGQLLDFGAGSRQAAPAGVTQQMARGAGGEVMRLGLQPVSASLSDESILYDLDVRPAGARVPESLQYLNAITPSARDLDAR